MAAHAGDFDVPAEQGERSHTMVKDVRIEPDDVLITTFVFGMAVFAFGGGDVRDRAMKTALSDNIPIYVLVAQQAQVVLTSLLEAAMAFFTVFLEFGMALNNRPWHHQ